jgi:hypothetical protein
MTARLMKSSAIADIFTVDTTRKPGRPAAKPRASKPAPRKRAPVTKPTDETAELTPARDDRRPLRRRRWFLITPTTLVALAACAGTAFFLLQDDRANQSPAAAAPAAVSESTLAAFAASHDDPVYWVGPIASRTLELTATVGGTFVRYLPLGAPVGDSERAITVGTYPMPGAHATAERRASAPGMTSLETADGGLVVWSKARPTSVYVAFRGVPQLVEVYAPDADEARRLALSGRVRPVR